MVQANTYKNHYSKKKENRPESIKGYLLHGKIFINYDTSHSKAGNFVCVDTVVSLVPTTGAGLYQVPHTHLLKKMNRDAPWQKPASKGMDEQGKVVTEAPTKRKWLLAAELP